MAKYTVVNPRNIINDTDNIDKNCCTVLALSVVTGRTFKECHDFLALFGRVKNKGMFESQIERAFSSKMKHFYFKKGCYTREDSITLNQFIRKHPEGRYYILSRGHAYAVIDGIIYDYKESMRRKVISAWRVYTKEEIDKITKSEV